MGGHQSRSGCGGEEKNSQLLPGLELQITQHAAQRYTTEISWLLEKITKRGSFWSAATGWAGHVVCTKERRNKYKVLESVMEEIQTYKEG
jgi:hypothetical protein